MTKAERYVRYRLEGHSSRASARRAGFSAGKASEHARQLYDDVEQVLEAGRDACEWILRRERELTDRLEEIQRQANACRLLENAGVPPF